MAGRISRIAWEEVGAAEWASVYVRRPVLAPPPVPRPWAMRLAGFHAATLGVVAGFCGVGATCLVFFVIPVVALTARLSAGVRLASFTVAVATLCAVGIGAWWPLSVLAGLHRRALGRWARREAMWSAAGQLSAAGVAMAVYHPLRGVLEAMIQPFDGEAGLAVLGVLPVAAGWLVVGAGVTLVWTLRLPGTHSRGPGRDATSAPRP